MKLVLFFLILKTFEFSSINPILNVFYTSSTSVNLSWESINLYCSPFFILTVITMDEFYQSKRKYYELNVSKNKSYSLDNLIPGSLTKFNLKSKIHCKDEMKSIVLNNSTSNKPLPPKFIECDVNDSLINLKWAMPNKPSYFQMFILNVSSENYTETFSFRSDETSFVFDKAEPGKIYEFKLSCDSLYNYFDHISNDVVDKCITHPLHPENIFSTVLSPYTFLINWDKPSRGDFDHFNIYLNGFSYSTVSANTTQLIFSKNIYPGKIHNVIVQTLSNGKRSVKYKQIFVKTPPIPPEMVSHKWLNESTVLIEWQTNNRSLHDSFNIQIEQDDRIFYVGKTNKKSINVNNLNRSSSYIFSITTVSNKINSSSLKIKLQQNEMKSQIYPLIELSQKFGMLTNSTTYHNEFFSKFNGNLTYAIGLLVFMGMFYLFF